MFILQGEAHLARENHNVASFRISGIAPGPVGQESIDETFHIDENGLLKVTARNVISGQAEQLIVTRDQLNLPD